MQSRNDPALLEALLNNILDYTESVLHQEEFSTFLLQTIELIQPDAVFPMLYLLDRLCADRAEASTLMEILVQTMQQYPLEALEDESEKES